MEKHRRAQIIDALTHLFANHLLVTERRARFAENNGYTDFFDDPDPEFPSHVETIQKRYIHWTTLDEQDAIPALLINYAHPRNPAQSQRKGGKDTGAKFASLGWTEEYLPIQVVAVLKEKPNSPDPQLVRPLTDQIADMIFSIEQIVNGACDLGVEGVQEVELEGLPSTSEGRIAAIAHTPMEVLIFKIIVTHIFRSTTSV